MQAHPELADVYKLEAAVKGFAGEHIPDSEDQKMFLEAIRQESFNALAMDNQRSARPRNYRNKTLILKDSRPRAFSVVAAKSVLPVPSSTPHIPVCRLDNSVKINP